MPRAPRVQVADATYHVTSAGCAQRNIFRDDEDRITFVTILALALDRHVCSCLAMCLMGTHYHLLLEPDEPNLAASMQWLNMRYARAFNRRHGGSGAVFKSRYHSRLIETDSHLLEVCRYIALNPVRAGLCDRAEDWRWSSYAGCVGLARPWPFVADRRLLELFGSTRDEARRAFSAFVDEGLATRSAQAAVSDTYLTPAVGC